MIEQPSPKKAYTVNSFCDAHETSRTELYKLWKAGKGPRYFLIGKHRRISDEAAADWRREMEVAAATAQAT
jgi:hypothetical protein